MRRRTFFLLGLFILAVLLAPLAQRVFQIVLLEPVAYYWWWVRQVIHVIPETLYWYFFIACFGGIAILLLLREMFMLRIIKEDRAVQKGPVEFLSEQIVRSAKSNYFKWIIANRLANIALHVLWQNKGNGEKSRDFSHTDQAISPAIKSYLDAGILNSFMDYRKERKWFLKPQETPFNIDIHQVLDWVESQMEQ